MDEEKICKKRERCKNYTNDEKEEFLNIVEKYISVVENKKTDNISVKQKNGIWKKISQEFNYIQSSGIRNGFQLKNLYESIKKKAKKDKADDKMEIYKTGGGTFKSKMDNLGEKVIDMLGNNIMDIENEFDSSSMKVSETINVENDDNNIGISSTNVSVVQEDTNVHDIINENNTENQKSIRGQRKRKAQCIKNSNFYNKQLEIQNIKIDILKLKREKEEIRLQKEKLEKQKLELEVEEKKLELELKKKTLFTK